MNSVKYLYLHVKGIEDMSVGLCSYLDFKFTLKKKKQHKTWMTQIIEIMIFFH